MRSQTPAPTILRPLFGLVALLLFLLAPAEATNFRFLPVGSTDTLEYIAYSFSVTEGYTPTDPIPTERFRQFGLRLLGSDSFVVSRQTVDTLNPAPSAVSLDTLLVSSNLVQGRRVSYDLPDTTSETKSIQTISWVGLNKMGTQTYYRTATTAKTCRLGTLRSGEQFLSCKTTVEESSTDGNRRTSVTMQYFLEGVGEIRYAYNWKNFPAGYVSSTYGASTRELARRRGQPFPWATYVADIDAEVAAGVTPTASRGSMGAYHSGLLTNARINVLGRTGSHTATPFVQPTDRPHANGN